MSLLDENESSLLSWWSWHRYLENNNTTEVPPNDGETLRNTLMVYGGIYVVCMFLFCCVRRGHPKTFQVRAVNPKYECELATEQYGFFNWTWRLLLVNEDDIMDQCGLDALCFLRILSFGAKVSFVGVLNSVWLMPIYATSPESDETDYIKDGLTKVSATNVPASNARLIATAIATYIVMVFAMRLILKEFEWFTAKRHLWLSRQEPRNYTIYIQGICYEYQSSAALYNYFADVFGEDSVLEAHVALDIPNLEKKVAKRQALLEKLEHAIAIEEVKGKKATHKSSLIGGEEMDSVETYAEELREMNREIAQDIMHITAMYDPALIRQKQTGSMDSSGHFSEMSEHGNNSRANESFSVISSIADESAFGKYEKEKANAAALKEQERNKDVSFLESEEYDNAPRETAQAQDADNYEDDYEDDANPDSKKTSGLDIVKASMQIGTEGLKNVGSAAKNVGSAAKNVGNAAMALITSNEDGKAREAGFVTFKKLTTTHAARQMIHHHEPFVMLVSEAPEPHDIFWHFVGKNHKQLQSGKLLSFCLTVALCLFWTIPVSFIASLASVDALKERVGFIQDWLEKWPGLEQLLAQIAPLLIVALNAVLPYILLEIARLELPIGRSILEASLFVKLSIFMIIQTFFVSAISGSIFTTIDTFINNPTAAIDLLATSLPSQAIYFVQILLVSCFLGQSIELLNLGRVVVAKIRSWVGPNLTEKERNTPWMGLITLLEPWEFMFGIVLGTAVLYYMVTFVYSSMAPVTNFFCCLCYTLLNIGWRNQFIYIYPPIKDSGGLLWTGFIGIVITCMIIAEFVLLGWFGIKKAPVSAGLMVPLIIITFLFSFYIRQQHFVVTQHLPTGECIEEDYKNMPMDYSFVQNQYLQPALCNEDLEPDNGKDIFFRDAEEELDAENQGLFYGEE